MAGKYTPRSPQHISLADSRGEARESASLQVSQVLLGHINTEFCWIRGALPAGRPWPPLPGPAHLLTPGAPCISENCNSGISKRGLHSIELENIK